MKIGFFIFHRIDGRGGLENALIKTVDNLKNLGDESFLLFWENTIYPEFLDKFDHSSIAYSEDRISFKKIFLPKFLNRRIQRSRDYQKMLTFFKEKIIPLNLDALIVIDLPDTLVTFKKIFTQYKKKYNTPILSWIHGSISGSTPKQIKRITQLLPIFNQHMTVSRGISSELEQIYNINNTMPVQNPIDPANIIPRGKNNFIYIGRIGDPRKQIDRLLQALPTLKGKWSLEIFGSTGSDAKDDDFVKKINNLNLQDHIIFHGWVDDPWLTIKNADLLLLNSYTEGFGLVLAEAMMRGIPCISSDCPVGPREIIQHDINGWLFEVGDEMMLISILQEIIDNNRTLPDADIVKNTIIHYRSDIAVNDFREKLKKTIRAVKLS